MSASDSLSAVCMSPVGRDSTVMSIGSSACQTSAAQTFGIDNSNTLSSLKRIGAGFIVIPQSGNFSVLQPFQFATGKDLLNGGSIMITIEFSQSTNNIYLLLGSAWNLIFYEWTGISFTNDPGRIASHWSTIFIQSLSHTHCLSTRIRQLCSVQRSPTTRLFCQLIYNPKRLRTLFSCLHMLLDCIMGEIISWINI